MTEYHHTQRAPLCLLLYALAITFLGLGFAFRNPPVIVFIFLMTGMLMFILAASFHQLTVVDEGDRLLIHFGPIPLFRRTVRYEDIQSIDVGRTTILDGWGIHMSLRGGWVWNIWGRDCVVLHFNRGTLRIGTDDAENLAEFVETKIANDHAKT